MTTDLAGHKPPAAPTRSETQALRRQQRERFDELTAHIERNLHNIKDAFVEVGMCLAEIRNNKLYGAAEYGSFEEMLTDRGYVALGQASKLIAVAELVPRESALALGIERSYALTRYAQVATPPTSIRSLLRGGIEGTPVGDWSLRRLNEVVRRAREKSRGADEDVKEARKIARTSQADLRKRGLASATITPVRARGAWRFRIELDAEDVVRLGDRPRRG